jgi:hypothetical protein
MSFQDFHGIKDDWLMRVDDNPLFFAGFRSIGNLAAWFMLA